MAKNYNCYFKTKIAPKIGDLVATGGMGQCKVIDITPGEICVENVITAEIASVFIDDCDLISRAG
jgi:hypothetical protein